MQKRSDNLDAGDLYVDAVIPHTREYFSELLSDSRTIANFDEFDDGSCFAEDGRQ